MTKSAPPPPRAYKLKMAPAVAAFTKGKAEVALRLPLCFNPGDRLFMVEFAGATTGRADLCTVLRVDENNCLVLARMWCWQQGKHDDDLSGLAWTLQPDEFPLVTKEAIP